MAAGVAAGIVLATAALVVALTRHSATPPTPAQQAASSVVTADTTEADRRCATRSPRCSSEVRTYATVSLLRGRLIHPPQMRRYRSLLTT